MSNEREPLSELEEAALRESVAWLEEHGKEWAGRYDVLRLLATLDAARPPVDGERSLREDVARFQMAEWPGQDFVLAEDYDALAR